MLGGSFAIKQCAKNKEDPYPKSFPQMGQGLGGC